MIFVTARIFFVENFVVGRSTIGKSFRFWKSIRSAVSFGLTMSTLMFARVADFADVSFDFLFFEGLSSSAAASAAVPGLKPQVAELFSQVCT